VSFHVQYVSEIINVRFRYALKSWPPVKQMISTLLLCALPSAGLTCPMTPMTPTVPGWHYSRDCMEKGPCGEAAPQTVKRLVPRPPRRTCGPFWAPISSVAFCELLNKGGYALVPEQLRHGSASLQVRRQGDKATDPRM